MIGVGGVGGEGMEEAGKGWWERPVVVGGRVMAKGKRGRRPNRFGLNMYLTNVFYHYKHNRIVLFSFF